MIRIAQNNLRLYIIKKFALVHAFYRCLRADRHKDRRLNHAVIRGNMPDTRGRVGAARLFVISSLMLLFKYKLDGVINLILQQGDIEHLLYILYEMEG